MGTGISRWAGIRPAERMGADGFALPAVILGLVVMSTLAVASIVTVDDEHRSSQAMRESGAAFYAAEAGFNEIWGTWDDSLIFLDPGDSLDLGSRSLPDGSSYRGVVRRLDNGGQKVYEIAVFGRAPAPFSSEALITLLLTSDFPGKLGRCCAGPATVDGWINMQHTGTLLDGFDRKPPSWSDDDCPDDLQDKPGVLMKDTTLFDIDNKAQLLGDPPLVHDTTINEKTFSEFGPDLSWSGIKSKANHTLGTWGSSEKEYKVKPSYNPDGSCNTTDPLNWGSPIPGDACYNYFPIILMQGDVSLQGGTGVYGQALVILDWNETTRIGTELDLETKSVFNGIILGKGCIEIQGGSVMHGAIFADGNFFNEDLCAGDAVLEMNADSEGGPGAGKLNWSQCVVDRTLTNTGLDYFADGEGARILASRAFTEPLR